MTFCFRQLKAQRKTMKRGVVILGAGASVEFGAPTTIKLTEKVEQHVCSDFLMKQHGGDIAFRKIKEILLAYLGDPALVHYERIYHCVHELIQFFPPNERIASEYRPLLVPFIQPTLELTKISLEVLDRRILQAIYKEISSACKTPACSLGSFCAFLQEFKKDHILRIYSTNHDDFPLQAVGDLYTGFELNSAPFDVDRFWREWNVPAIFHLHGSIHMGFADPSEGRDISEIIWFTDRDDAYNHMRFMYPSGERRPDGGLAARFPLITGLDKLSNIQQRPFCYYYAALAKDLAEADLIYVIGSGLGDLHVNTWLREARSRKPFTPLLFVGYWPNGFANERFELNHNLIEMSHSLNVYTDDLLVQDYRGMAGWTVTKDRTAAIWDQGFQKFLANPDALKSVLKLLAFQ
jgi:hypothetical protein